ncbi:hypothetical protein B9G98_01888 [Wickerhamiella sorbophila]|uniref:Uncharacterized protein n=1 Tax=Wickerhamiella sorbophila TaxID=45607 RepID=A0A2T0FGZ3_9ASCO|nr:hypothetical protein B9G98_01888 [Wickerhamiella sorbophila]PRT54268.1 hypothetical protein B9G98_01888 [Wickerhamiella sorbophila]
MLLSDSDDELDVSSIRTQRTPQSNYNDELKKQVYEKAGENAILRQQLTLQASKHNGAINDLIKSHQRINESHTSELEKLRSQLKSVESELQFAKEEMRMRSVDTAMKSEPFTMKATPARSLPPRFADGFVVKRPKISKGRTPEPARPDAATGLLAINSLPHEGNIVTIQFLYGIPHPEDPRKTIGAAIAAENNPEGQVNETMRTIFKTDSLEVKQALLILVYGFCQTGVFPEHETLIQLQQLTVDCLRVLKPFPPIENAIGEFVVKSMDANLLSTILYSLDVLACFPDPGPTPELFDLIIASKIPAVIDRGFAIFSLSPNVVVEERRLFFDAPPEPKLELLFGGILDNKVHAMGQHKYSQEYISLNVQPKDVDMEEVVRESYLSQRAAGILLAASRPPSKLIRTEVENIFISQVDSSVTVSQLVLISRCVWYLWSILDSTTRTGNTDELVVACAQVAYSPEYPKQVTMWALDILHQLVDPAEMNIIADELS